MSVDFYAQTMAGALAAFQRAADSSPVVAVGEFPLSCSIALVLVGVDTSSLASRTVDAVTGRRGFSHVYLDLCLAVDGRHRVIDYTITDGVHFAIPEKYAACRREWVTLPAVLGAEVWACVRARMARPLRVLPLALGNNDDTCIGLVVACMPERFRAELEILREGPCVSPNTLARWAGVK